MRMKDYLDNLLLRSEEIQTTAKANDSYVRFGDYAKDIDRWINDVDIFYQRNLQNHPLGNRIRTLIFHRSKNCFQELINCLQSVSHDNYFLDKECGKMKDYEKFLKRCIETVDQKDPYHRVSQYELKGDDQAIIEKLKSLGCISNVTYMVMNMGTKYVGFDITYDGLHYFDESDESDNDDMAHDADTNIVYREKINGNDSTIKYDLFISHANKDKISFVEELKQVLDRLGISIFYDKDSIEWGDEWKKKILEGVAQSEFAIIVVSENFFGREWTEKELSEFLSRQNSSGQKIILPILFNISVKQLESQYPDLANIQAISANDYSKEEIALLFAQQYIKRIKSCSKGAR